MSAQGSDSGDISCSRRRGSPGSGVQNWSGPVTGSGPPEAVSAPIPEPEARDIVQPRSQVPGNSPEDARRGLPRAAGRELAAAIVENTRPVHARCLGDPHPQCTKDQAGIEDKEPGEVIDIISRRACPTLGRFHSIFCALARVWERDFKVLAVPHHTQVFALLVFKAFLEDAQERVRTLIAQASGVFVSCPSLGRSWPRNAGVVGDRAAWSAKRVGVGLVVFDKCWVGSGQICFVFYTCCVALGQFRVGSGRSSRAPTRFVLHSTKVVLESATFGLGSCRAGAEAASRVGVAWAALSICGSLGTGVAALPSGAASHVRCAGHGTGAGRGVGAGHGRGGSARPCAPCWWRRSAKATGVAVVRAGGVGDGVGAIPGACVGAVAGHGEGAGLWCVGGPLAR